MKVDVTVWPVEDKNNLLAFANVTLNDSFVVKGLKVCTGENGHFVAMPSAKDKQGEYHDVAFPITAEFRQKLVDAVLEEYSNPRPRENMQQQNAEAADRPQAETPETKLGVSVKTVDTRSKIVGLADVTLNKCFVVKDIKVCDGKKGIFVAMPSARDGNGDHHDTAFPITKEFREQLNNAVLDRYAKVVEKAQAKEDKKPSILNDMSDKQKEIQAQGRTEAPGQAYKKSNEERAG
jgi:stage V sporulation protein G